jgi:hypothetical protein
MAISSATTRKALAPPPRTSREASCAKSRPSHWRVPQLAPACIGRKIQAAPQAAHLSPSTEDGSRACCTYGFPSDEWIALDSRNSLSLSYRCWAYSPARRPTRSERPRRRRRATRVPPRFPLTGVSRSAPAASGLRLRAAAAAPARTRLTRRCGSADSRVCSPRSSARISLRVTPRAAARSATAGKYSLSS